MSDIITTCAYKSEFEQRNLSHTNPKLYTCMYYYAWYTNFRGSSDSIKQWNQNINEYLSL